MNKREPMQIAPFFTRYGNSILHKVKQSILACGLLTLWEYVLSPCIGSYWVSSPSKIGSTLLRWIAGDQIAVHVATTLLSASIGYSVGVLAATSLAFFGAVCPVCAKITAPFMAAGYTFPKEAVAPLFIILFGIGIGSKVAIAIASVFFIVYPSVSTGIRNVDKDMIDVLKVSGANSWQLFTMVVAPAAAPWIFVGMRISVRYAFTGVLFGEMLSGNRGLGYLVKYSANMFDASGVFAALSVVMIVGVLLTLILEYVEALGNRWRP